MNVNSNVRVQESEIMNGAIRPKGRCTVCQGKFTEIKKLGYICTTHQTVTRRKIQFLSAYV